MPRAPGFTGCRIFQIASYYEMGNLAATAKAVAVLLEQSPDFTVGDALKSMGFPGDDKANRRLARQLTAAGLPTGSDDAPEAD